MKATNEMWFTLFICFRLLVPIEHNFGMASSKSVNTTYHTTHWTNSQFHPLRFKGARGPVYHDLSCHALGCHARSSCPWLPCP